MRSFPLVLTAAVGLALFGGNVPVQAQDAGAPTQPAAAAPASVSGEIILLYGTNDGSGIDPKIGSLPALKQPPLSAYNSYKLVDHMNLTLQKGKASSTKLPTTRDLGVTYTDVATSTAKGDPKRYLVTTTILNADGSTFLPSLSVTTKSGDYYFVGGQNYKAGGLIVGIKINTPSGG
jgi:hypothetical protein